ncbi:S41 family peptidase [candidate division KSB1 bacterium]|nr:S41 family peptidase [candidate division KSB1 bacterium]
MFRLKLYHRWLSFIIFAFFSINFRPDNLLAQHDNLSDKIQIFNFILKEVQKSYIDPVDPTDLIDEAIRGMLANLDPHTTYLSRDQFESWNKSFEGFSGIGIYYNIIDGRIIIMSLLENGPAEQAGVFPGDEILTINGEVINSKPQSEIISLLKGYPGTKVTIQLKRYSCPEPKNFTLIRDQVFIKSIEDTYLLSEEIGYIKMNRFTASTSSELYSGIKNLQKAGMKRLILDLRDNGGGLMSAAIEVADLFLPGKRKIVRKKGRNENSQEAFYTSGQAPFSNLPLILLLNHGSASASEILAGAIQDWDRGLIIGEASFGKGLVQSQIRFPDNSALLITTARYYTPSGRLLQRDYRKKTKDQYYAEAYNDSIRNALTSNTKTFKTMQGRLLSSQGGIMPDIPLNSTQNEISQELKQLVFYGLNKNLLLDILVDEYLSSDNELLLNLADRNNYQKLDRFIHHFCLNSKLLKALSDQIKQINYPFTQKQIANNIADLEFLIKGNIAYRIWGDFGRFKVKLTRDNFLQESPKHFQEAENLLKHSLQMYSHVH